MDFNRREFLAATGLAGLGLLSSGTGSAQSDQFSTNAAGFQDAAQLLGPDANRPAPDSPFFDDKVRYSYIYEDITTERRYYKTQDMDSWRGMPPFSPDVITAAVTVADTTAETELFQYDVPNQELQTTAHYDVELFGQFSNASTSDLVTLRLYMDGIMVAETESTGKNADTAPWNAQTAITVDDGEARAHTVASWNQAKADDHHAVEPIDDATDATIRATVQWNNAKAGNRLTASQGLVKRWR